MSTVSQVDFSATELAIIIIFQLFGFTSVGFTSVGFISVGFRSVGFRSVGFDWDLILSYIYIFLNHPCNRSCASEAKFFQLWPRDRALRQHGTKKAKIVEPIRFRCEILESRLGETCGRLDLQADLMAPLSNFEAISDCAFWSLHSFKNHFFFYLSFVSKASVIWLLCRAEVPRQGPSSRRSGWISQLCVFHQGPFMFPDALKPGGAGCVHLPAFVPGEAARLRAVHWRLLPCWWHVGFQDFLQNHVLAGWMQHWLADGCLTWVGILDGYIAEFWLPRLFYCTDMKSSGVIRPWQCGWRSDFSMSGMVDPEVALNLMEIICVEGLLGLKDIAMIVVCSLLWSSALHSCARFSSSQISLTWKKFIAKVWEHVNWGFYLMLILLASKKSLPRLCRKHSWKDLGRSFQHWTTTAPRAKHPTAINMQDVASWIMPMFCIFCDSLLVRRPSAASLFCGLYQRLQAVPYPFGDDPGHPRVGISRFSAIVCESRMARFFLDFWDVWFIDRIFSDVLWRITARSDLCEASMGTIHVNFGQFKDVQSQVYSHRGSAMHLLASFVTSQADLWLIGLPFDMIRCARCACNPPCDEKTAARFQLAPASTYIEESWTRRCRRPTEGLHM